MRSIAVFVSPHGFGHAARACAVVDALSALAGGIRAHLFTLVPRWFFEESLTGDHDHHPCEADVGLVQASSLVHDVEATVARLRDSPWRRPAAVDALAAEVSRLGCQLVVADIAPLGLRVARRAGLPSVLIESFTWRWIYDRLADASSALRDLGEEMGEDAAGATLRVQAEPCCEPLQGSIAVPPVARRPRLPRERVRKALDVPPDAPMVLASMGGVRWQYGGLGGLAASHDGPWIVVPGGSEAPCREGRVILLPFHGSIYHPDLVGAADAVVGKLGYSTVAEAARAGAAFAWVDRPGFPETPILARYVARHLAARELDRGDFVGGRWLPTLEALLAEGRRAASAANGAAAAARAIVGRFPELLG